MRITRSVVALSGLLLCGSLGWAAAAPRPVRHAVTIEATAFATPSLMVRVGDTIVWTNKDPFPHTVTSKAGGFDSGTLLPDKSWRLTPKKKGEFDYICSLHPTMKGTLRVE
jgi:plastocyanin